MKKLVGIISACLMLCTAAFAEGYFSAEDQEKGTITEDKAVEDGFVLHATTEKYMNITKKPLHKAANGEEFNMALQLQGSGNASSRSVSFPAKAGETITVWGNSTSKTDMRSIVVIGPDGKSVAELSMDKDVNDEGGLASEGSVKVSVDGTYTVFSKKSGINIYKINVGK